MKTVSAFHAIKQGILICDKLGRIVYFNAAYEEYIGVDLAEAKGRMITEYRKGALVPMVIRNGTPIENVLRKEHGQEYLACVYPIIEDDHVKGSISIVTSIVQSQNQIEQAGKTLAERVKEYEKREIEYMISVYGSSLESKRKIAKELDISLATLYNKLNQ